MKTKGYIFLSVISLGTLLIAGTIFESEEVKTKLASKINGVNFVAPMNEINAQNLNSLQRINADWIAVIPYAYTPRNESNVNFYNHHPHWWGEGIQGTIATISMAKEKGLNVMLKPQVWVIGDGWPGDFRPNSEKEWKIWENGYSEYILTYAKICDSLNVDLFCIATEYKLAVQHRPEFWIKLIKDIKKKYSGPLTYAANWDNYQKVKFWAELDFIGIDAYFPLSEEKTPSIEELTEAWKNEISEIEEFSKKYNMQVLFTEYGYRSRDFSAHTQWNKSESGDINLLAQSNAYQALYSSIWNETWMSGGFLWKWFAHDQDAGGIKDRNYTPQNKPAEEIVKTWYSKH